MNFEVSCSHSFFTAHEHYPEFNIINMNGRLYDPVIGRFFSPDNFVQTPEFTQGFNRYSYCLNNPLKYTDPTGQMFSPYYDKLGNFLGVDENGFKGDIYITTKEAFNASATDGIANSMLLQANKATRFIRDNPTNVLSLEAQSKIMTHILQDMSDINLSKLYNGEISVFEGTANNGKINVGYNDPANTGRMNFTDAPNGQFRITAKTGELNSLGTVEAVKSYLGIHEYKSHGVLGIPGDENPIRHREAYRNQYNHWTYKFLSIDQQTEIKNRMNGIYTW